MELSEHIWCFSELVNQSWDHAPDVDACALHKILDERDVGDHIARTKHAIQAKESRHQDVHDNSGTVAHGERRIDFVTFHPVSRPRQHAIHGWKQSYSIHSPDKSMCPRNWLW